MLLDTVYEYPNKGDKPNLFIFFTHRNLPNEDSNGILMGSHYTLKLSYIVQPCTCIYLNYNEQHNYGPFCHAMPWVLLVSKGLLLYYTSSMRLQQLAQDADVQPSSRSQGSDLLSSSWSWILNKGSAIVVFLKFKCLLYIVMSLMFYLFC